MEEKKTRLLVFIVSFTVPLVYYRLLHFFFYEPGQVWFVRSMTGLTVHHLHYGIILLVISSLMFMFYRNNNYTVALTGLGLGLTLDSFIGSLLLETVRDEEMLAYNQSLIPTIVLFSVVIITYLALYLIRERKAA